MSSYKAVTHPVRGTRAYAAVRDIVVGDRIADLLGGPGTDTARRGWLTVDAPFDGVSIRVVSHERDAWGNPIRGAVALLGPDDVIEIAPREAT